MLAKLCYVLKMLISAGRMLLNKKQARNLDSILTSQHIYIYIHIHMHGGTTWGGREAKIKICKRRSLLLWERTRREACTPTWLILEPASRKMLIITGVRVIWWRSICCAIALIYLMAGHSRCCSASRKAWMLSRPLLCLSVACCLCLYPCAPTDTWTPLSVQIARSVTHPFVCINVVCSGLFSTKPCLRRTTQDQVKTSRSLQIPDLICLDCRGILLGFSIPQHGRTKTPTFTTLQYNFLMCSFLFTLHGCWSSCMFH